MKLTEEGKQVIRYHLGVGYEGEYIDEVLNSIEFKEKYLSPDFILVKESYFNGVTEKSDKWDKWQEDLHNLAQKNKTPYYLMLKENKRLTEQNEKISNALVAEMVNTKQMLFLKHELEEKREKLIGIVNLDIGWATPKDLLETIKREVLYKIDPALQSKKDAKNNILQ